MSKEVKLCYEILESPEKRFETKEDRTMGSFSLGSQPLFKENFGYYLVRFRIQDDDIGESSNTDEIEEVKYRIPRLGFREISKRKDENNVDFSFELATYKMSNIPEYTDFHVVCEIFRKGKPKQPERYRFHVIIIDKPDKPNDCETGVEFE